MSGTFAGRSRLLHFYNDSAATIPEAAAAALEALPESVLITGGPDKNLDFTPLVAALARSKSATSGCRTVLLAGSGTEKLICLLREREISYNGPFNSLEAALEAALSCAKTVEAAETEPVNIILSPGCSSFGMFANEFERGAKWKEAVLAYFGDK